MTLCQKFLSLATVLISHVCADINVVSYNQYWWHVKQFNEWSSLYGQLSKYRDADLLGFQECENVAQVLQGAGFSGHSYYQGPNKPSGNPAPLVWNAYKFQQLSGPASVHVSDDKYGARYLNYIRLREISSGQTIFFGNTHGPLDNCGPTVGQNWVNAINYHRQSGDHIIVTGDFNCGRDTQAVGMVKRVVPGGVDLGVDHIMSTLATNWGGQRDGHPSDHPLLQASFRTNGAGPAPSPPAPAPPAPAPGGCPGRSPCCRGCPYNWYCPTNNGCFRAGQHGCPGGMLCPPVFELDGSAHAADNQTFVV
jgi:hypothetical protein|eukprot:TRINITY_DN3073_c0_g1_i1.p1 TRINITY_DN3073_c0_g1~~TRINITY_DN3073_c0_g1_i1.p1  ORF type:complete len:308 (-),score=26.22 TRINITY_DN3073_c0_g1_i1:208-1131(-)